MPEKQLTPESHPGFFSWHIQEKLNTEHLPCNLGIFYDRFREGKLGGVILRHETGDTEHIDISDAIHKAFVRVGQVLSAESGSSVYRVDKIIFY